MSKKLFDLSIEDYGSISLPNENSKLALVKIIEKKSITLEEINDDQAVANLLLNNYINIVDSGEDVRQNTFTTTKTGEDIYIKSVFGEDSEDDHDLQEAINLKKNLEIEPEDQTNLNEPKEVIIIDSDSGSEVDIDLDVQPEDEQEEPIEKPLESLVISEEGFFDNLLIKTKDFFNLKSKRMDFDGYLNNKKNIEELEDRIKSMSSLRADNLPSLNLSGDLWYSFFSGDIIGDNYNNLIKLLEHNIGFIKDYGATGVDDIIKAQNFMIKVVHEAIENPKKAEKMVLSAPKDTFIPRAINKITTIKNSKTTQNSKVYTFGRYYAKTEKMYVSKKYGSDEIYPSLAGIYWYSKKKMKKPTTFEVLTKDQCASLLKYAKSINDYTESLSYAKNYRIFHNKLNESISTLNYKYNTERDIPIDVRPEVLRISSFSYDLYTLSVDLNANTHTIMYRLVEAICKLVYMNLARLK